MAVIALGLRRHWRRSRLRRILADERGFFGTLFNIAKGAVTGVARSVFGGNGQRGGSRVAGFSPSGRAAADATARRAADAERRLADERRRLEDQRRAFEQKQAAVEAKRAAELVQRQAQQAAKQQRTLLFAVGGGGLLLLIVVLFMFAKK